MIEQTDIYRHAPHVAARNIAGEVILVPTGKTVGSLESIYTLNETAARAWDLMDGQRSLAEIKTVIQQEYTVEDERAGQDLDRLVSQLLQIQAILKV